jgi:hypothetical protein
MASKELKRDKLYLLDLEYTCELDTGNTITVREKCVGYVIGKQDTFFYGSVFDLEGGRYTGGDTVEMSVTDFNNWVKSIKEIA